MRLSTPPGGRELGYAEITSSFPITTTPTAVTGLAVTVQATGRPLAIEAYASVQKTTGAGALVLVVYEDGVQVQVSNVGGLAVGEYSPLFAPVRRVPAPGSHTYAVVVIAGSTDGVVAAAAGAPAYLAVTER